MIKMMKSAVALTVICAVVAVLLAATNFITAPVIQANDAAAANEALLVVMPNGTGFEAVDISSYTLPSTVNEVFKEANGGYVVKLTTAGYSTGMVIMVGVDANGAVTGATCLSSGETLGYEKTYGETTVGATLETVDGLDTIAGATRTTDGYKNAVKDALNTAVIMGGGSVDIRNPEQILTDNLNTALPEGEGEFTSFFIQEVLDVTDAVYHADNDAGYVFVSGESFIGVDRSGNVISEVEEALKVSIESDAKTFLASEVEMIDLSAYENIPSQIVNAYRTLTGNYVFELKAAGYGINGGDKYHPASGEYIEIMVSATKEGVIIDCVTTYQAETENIGSVCADPEFYSQFDGRSESDYNDIDAISGATLTTNGYKVAVGKIFDVIKILEGVA
ncbi:MAG: FMN-binding protein [Oscillospiraceae bacterium]|nr:FMN-binding protein [Oscillospiraceae bacterium]